MVNVSHQVVRMRAVANDLIQSNLRDGAEISFIVSTRSMIPTLAPGDRVIARGLSSSGPHIGDIVLVKTGQTWLAHRVIDRHRGNGKTFFVTKGDNSPRVDAVWAKDSLCGIIVSLQRAGYGVVDFQSKSARAFAAMLAFFSRWQGQSGRMRPGLVKNMACSSSLVLVRGISSLVQVAMNSKWIRGS